MGLARSAEEATRSRPATPKLAFVAAPSAYRTSSAKTVEPGAIDALARILSMGKLHHALTGTGAVALAVAGAVPGTVLNRLVATLPADTTQLRLGHPSGVLAVGAQARERGGQWEIVKAVVSRSARRLMAGHVFVPGA